MISLSRAPFLGCGGFHKFDIFIGEGAGLYSVWKDVTNLHVVVNLERPCDYVGAVELFVDDAAADRVAVHSDEKVKESCSVADNKLFVTVHGAEDLLGEIE